MKKKKSDELHLDEHNLIIFDDFICDKSSFDAILHQNFLLEEERRMQHLYF